MDDRIILRVGTKFLIPYILLFALYVQFHGDYGPGEASRPASSSRPPSSCTRSCTGWGR